MTKTARNDANVADFRGDDHGDRRRSRLVPTVFVARPGQNYFVLRRSVVAIPGLQTREYAARQITQFIELHDELDAQNKRQRR